MYLYMHTVFRQLARQVNWSEQVFPRKKLPLIFIYILLYLNPIEAEGVYRISRYFRVHYILANLASKIHIAKIEIAKINVYIH